QPREALVGGVMDAARRAFEVDADGVGLPPGNRRGIEEPRGFLVELKGVRKADRVGDQQARPMLGNVADGAVEYAQSVGVDDLTVLADASAGGLVASLL